MAPAGEPGRLGRILEDYGPLSTNPPAVMGRLMLVSSTGFADPRGMKPLLGNAAANSLTCHVREADANLLNLLPQSSPHLPANHSIQVHSTPCFL
jgi:hypothetical protein